jgi:hypothetical protein
MSTSVIIELDTTAPLIEFGPVSITAPLNLIVPYTINEPSVSSAKLITTIGDINGIINIDNLVFDLTASGIAGVQMLVVDLMDDVSNERQVTEPLVLRDISRIVNSVSFKDPILKIEELPEDPFLESVTFSDLSLEHQQFKEDDIEFIFDESPDISSDILKEGQ